MSMTKGVSCSLGDMVSLRLAEAGVALPQPPNPVGSYVAARQEAGWIYVSGQFPMLNGSALYRGQVGDNLTIGQGRDAARLAALNVLAQLQRILGSFDRLGGLVRMEGHVACAPSFTNVPLVLDAASDLFVSILGERGQHARTAFCHAALPLDMPVELVVVAKSG
jgi:enamine deaminase RidA (YjgF/YER057c/UK114 family)